MPYEERDFTINFVETSPRDDALSQFSPSSCKTYGVTGQVPDDILHGIDISGIPNSRDIVAGDTPSNAPYTISYSSSSSEDDNAFFSPNQVATKEAKKSSASASIMYPSSRSTSCSSEEAMTFVSPRGIRMQGLRATQFLSGMLSVFQMCILGVLYTKTSVPVSILLPSGDTFTKVVLFKISIDVLFIVRLGIAAIFSFLSSAPGWYEKYAIGIVDKHNYSRWVCYSITSPMLMISLALVLGTTDVWTLWYLLWLSCATIFFFCIQERYEFPGTGGQAPAICGWATGLVPWFGIGLYAFFPWGKFYKGYTRLEYSHLSVPMFCVGIVGYALYGVVHILQYNLVFVFSDYMTGELTFIILDILMNLSMTWLAHNAKRPE